MDIYRNKLRFIPVRQAEEDGELVWKGSYSGDMKIPYKKGDIILTTASGDEYVMKEKDFFYGHESPDAVFCDLCCDFDGVIHSYDSGWQGAHVIPDPIVPGAIEALYQYRYDGLEVAIYSARSSQYMGIAAMKEFIDKHDKEYIAKRDTKGGWVPLIKRLLFPVYKPAATVYLDDRGMTFNGPGNFPSSDDIRGFRPWYK